MGTAAGTGICVFKQALTVENHADIGAMLSTGGRRNAIQSDVGHSILLVQRLYS